MTQVVKSDSSCDTPLELHIVSGYRKPTTSYGECVLSAFRLHNETLNVWTHLSALLYFLVYFWRITALFSVPLEDYLHSSEVLPIYGHFAALFVLFFASSSAHLFNNMPRCRRDFFFFMDYAGIAACASCSSMVYIYYNDDHIQKYFHDRLLWFILLVTCAALFATLVSCKTRVSNMRGSVPLRTACFSLPFIVGNFPAACRFVSELMSHTLPYCLSCLYLTDVIVDVTDADFLRGHAHCFLYCKTIGLFCMACIFQVLHIPERFSPGSFDYIGHSHQWFHIFVFLGIREQFWLILEDIDKFVQRRIESGVRSDVPVIPASHVWVNYVVLIGGLAVIVLWFSLMHPSTNNDRQSTTGSTKAVMDASETSENNDNIKTNGQCC